MWIWQECEDYTSASGDVRVVDDWGAAAMRCVEMGRRAKLEFDFPLQSYLPGQLAIRYRYEGDRPGLSVTGPFGKYGHIQLEPSARGEWRWAVLDGLPLTTAIQLGWYGTGTCCLDGFFLYDGNLDLPDRARDLDAMLGPTEAQGLGEEKHRSFERRDNGSRGELYEWQGEAPSHVARAVAGDLWPTLQSLAQKPPPYIVKSYDTGGHTDYNADYAWHALDKEKRWQLPHSGDIGIINPNTGYYYALGFQFEGEEEVRRVQVHPALHVTDALIYDVELGPDLQCEVVFRCQSSHTVLALVRIANSGTETRDVILHEHIGQEWPENPPKQRYVLPNQKFGAGVTTTAGTRAWWTVVKGAQGMEAWCHYEWVRGRCRGRRLLVTAICDQWDEGAVDQQDNEDTGGLARELTAYEDGSSSSLVYCSVPPGGSYGYTIALNLHRFTLGDTWNPEITPELYKHETEQEAVEAGYRACVEALEDDLEEAIRRSIEPYRTFPKITLPVESWEADFYACLELPRASTFSPYREMKTPFYNFCRVHAHEPFGWWSYGMHAHESLCTLFKNVVDPRLSQQFLLGHIRHQREDGMYPYGVSHGTNPRLKTQEATAPLIVWEAWNAYLWSGDVEFLREAYESGKRSHEWWLRERDRCGEGLCHWLDTCNESVRDDADLATWVATGGSQYQEALDLNCYLLVQERTLAEMADELERLADVPPSPQPSPARGEGASGPSAPASAAPLRSATEATAARFAALAERRARLMNAYMWHEEDRCYYGIGEVEPGWARVKDISTFFPLWAKLAPRGRFERIVELVTDPETFGTPYGPPSLAVNEPGFGPEAHWKGANWVEMTMFVIAGLRNYGHYKLAADLAYRNTKMVFDELERYGHFREYFNSIEGNGVDLIDYIWTAMPAHFIVNVFFGIEPTAEGLSIMPSLPMDWREIEIERVHMRGKRVSVKVRLDDSVARTQTTIDGASATVRENRGVVIPWNELTEEVCVEIVQPACLTETYAAPPEAPLEWSSVGPHQYPDDSAPREPRSPGSGE